MSAMGQSLNNWLQRHGASVMGQEATVCDRFPENTRDKMWDISMDSARTGFVAGIFDPAKLREKGAPITKDYTLGTVRTGTRDRVLIPRPEGTIGTYHTHPFHSSFPSIIDAYEVLKHDDKVTCIGATGKPGTKIQCFTPNKPKWDEIQYKFRLLVDDIKDYNNKVGAKLKGPAPEILLRVARTEPYWYGEGKELQKRRDTLEGEIRAQLHELAAPEEWTAKKWTNGFSELPFFDVYPNMFNKCRIIWEELEEELPFEL